MNLVEKNKVNSGIFFLFLLMIVSGGRAVGCTAGAVGHSSIE